MRRTQRVILGVAGMGLTALAVGAGADNAAASTQPPDQATSVVDHNPIHGGLAPNSCYIPRVHPGLGLLPRGNTICPIPAPGTPTTLPNNPVRLYPKHG